MMKAAVLAGQKSYLDKTPNVSKLPDAVSDMAAGLNDFYRLYIIS